MHVLLVCAVSGGELGISLRSCFDLNFVVLDKGSDKWLEKTVFLSEFSIFGQFKIVLNEPFFLLCLQLSYLKKFVM